MRMNRRMASKFQLIQKSWAISASGASRAGRFGLTVKVSWLGMVVGHPMQQARSAY